MTENKFKYRLNVLADLRELNTTLKNLQLEALKLKAEWKVAEAVIEVGGSESFNISYHLSKALWYSAVTQIAEIRQKIIERYKDFGT